jgi:hypothetical protein
MAPIFSITWLVSALISEEMISPVMGFTGICPETNTKFPEATAWLYGPMGAGALSVLMMCFIVVCVYFFSTNHWISLYIIPATNMMMAIALMVCITFRLKLVGLFGSFFLKKYMNKFNKKRRLPGKREAFIIFNLFNIICS